MAGTLLPDSEGLSKLYRKDPTVLGFIQAARQESMRVATSTTTVVEADYERVHPARISWVLPAGPGTNCSGSSPTGTQHTRSRFPGSRFSGSPLPPTASPTTWPPRPSGRPHTSLSSSSRCPRPAASASNWWPTPTPSKPPPTAAPPRAPCWSKRRCRSGSAAAPVAVGPPGTGKGQGPDSDESSPSDLRIQRCRRRWVRPYTLNRNVQEVPHSPAFPRVSALRRGAGSAPSQHHVGTSTRHAASAVSDA